MADQDNTFQIALRLTEKLGELATKFEKDSGAMKSELTKQTEILVAVEAQTTKTNGRVTKSEQDIQTLKDLNTERKGRSAVIGALVGIITTIALATIGAFLKKYLGL